jgi:hypothetical protein
MLEAITIKSKQFESMPLPLLMCRRLKNKIKQAFGSHADAPVSLKTIRPWHRLQHTTRERACHNTYRMKLKTGKPIIFGMYICFDIALQICTGGFTKKAFAV